MLAYYLNLFFLFLKILSFFLAKIVFFNLDSLKLVCVLIFVILGFWLKKPKKKPRFKKLSQLRFYIVNRIFIIYRLDTLFDHIINWVYLICYTIIFFGLFLWLRFYNMNSNLDLKVIYLQLINLITQLTVLQLFINLSLLISLFFFIIHLFTRLRKYYYFQLMRQHWYLCGFRIYEKLFCKIKWDYINRFEYFIFTNVIIELEIYFALGYFKSINKFTKEEDEKFDEFYKKHPYSYSRFFARFFFDKGHYFFLLLCILYDLLFNNFVLSLTFKVLPFIFIYSIWYNICHFFLYKDFSLDQFINDMFYQHIVLLEPRWPGDKPHAFINGRLSDISHWLPHFTEYEQNGFESK